MSKTVLITGGMGYLGGRIAVAVAREARWRVRIGSRRKLFSPEWLPEAETAVLDLSRPETFGPALSNVEAVVHLAALNEIESAADPEKAARINTRGTSELLESAIQAGVRRFIYFSTVHVYGAPLAGHITEQTIPRPVHPYATTHHAAEAFVLAANNRDKIQGIGLRLSNGFGAPTHMGVNRWTLLVNAFCRQAVDDKKLVLHSNGLQQRDFITLHDVGRVVCHFLDLPGADCADGLFNVGGECSMTVWAMTQRIIQCCRKTLGYVPEVVRPESGSDEAAAGLEYDISKLKQTGFLLNGDMDVEINQTLRMCAAMHQQKRT